MQTIQFDGKNYKIGFSFRAIDNFEKLAGKSITQAKTTWDNVLFFYSTLKALNHEFTTEFETFLDVLDKDPQTLTQFQYTDIMGATDEEKEQHQNILKKKHTTKEIFVLWMLLPLFAATPVLIPIISIIGWIGASLWLLLRLIGINGRGRGQ